MPSAFKGSSAFGVQGFKGLRRSSACGVQMPAAFKGSRACGVQGFQGFRVQGFKGLRRLRVQGPAAFKGSKGISVPFCVLSASVVKRV